MASQKIRLIQTGDWHLFANLSSWPTAGYKHRENRLKECILKIFEESKDADFLVLTGDLIDLRNLVDHNDECLSWLHEEMTVFGKDRIIVTYGSHDDKTIRKWFSSRTASRHLLETTTNVFTISYTSKDIIFYAIDSDFENSSNQGSILKKSLDAIITDREGLNSHFRHAVILSQLGKGDCAKIFTLKDCINFAALGDHHFAHLVMDKSPRYAYAGAPVARDACTFGDCGPRWFNDVEIDNAGQVRVEKISLLTGGYQVKVRNGPDSQSITILLGPGPENKNILKIKKSDTLPEQLIEKVEDLTRNQWTCIALANSLPYREKISHYIRQQYETSLDCSFLTYGKMQYFFRK